MQLVTPLDVCKPYLGGHVMQLEMDEKVRQFVAIDLEQRVELVRKKFSAQLLQVLLETYTWQFGMMVDNEHKPLLTNAGAAQTEHVDGPV